MRYFLDCEFIDDGKVIDLITIAIVAEDDRELYLGHKECRFYNASDWVKENVLAQLDGLQNNLSYLACDRDRNFWLSKKAIALSIFKFVGGECDQDGTRLKLKEQPEFWGYYADYDWIVLAQIYGKMMDLPDGFPYHCNDIKQECDRLGNPELPPQINNNHNALSDARWSKEAFEFLQRIEFTEKFKVCRDLEDFDGINL
jgi:hypothetical protein